MSNTPKIKKPWLRLGKPGTKMKFKPNGTTPTHVNGKTLQQIKDEYDARQR